MQNFKEILAYDKRRWYDSEIKYVVKNTCENEKCWVVFKRAPGGKDERKFVCLFTFLHSLKFKTDHYTSFQIMFYDLVIH